MQPNAQNALILPEDDAQAVALVRAVEDSDRSGNLLPLAERRAATAAALDRHSGGKAGPWIAGRARRLVTALRREYPFLARFLRYSSPVRGLLVPALAVAFGFGLATNALGPEKRINVLAVPLLGLILWNLAILGLTAVRAALPLNLGSGAPRFVGYLEAMARRLVDRLPRPGLADGEQDRLKQALGRYLTDWLPAVAPLAAVRGRRLLHASSLMLISGAVAGMYLRGVAFQYQATWESTFLSAGGIDAFLKAILAPASVLSGLAVPSAAAIESPAAGNAAPWIHLWAVTAALFVGLPRLVLAAVFSLRCGHRRRRLEVPVPGAYRRRLLASVDTAEHRLEVMPYSYRLPAAAAKALKGMLYDLFGPRSEIRLRPALDYGYELERLEPGDSRLRLVLFGLAQTPEVEVHGELLRYLRDGLPDGQALLTVIDESAYRQRLEAGGSAGQRLAERRRAWDRVVRDAGLEAVHVDLSDPDDDDVSTRLLAAAWPAGVLGGEP